MEYYAVVWLWCRSQRSDTCDDTAGGATPFCGEGKRLGPGGICLLVWLASSFFLASSARALLRQVILFYDVLALRHGRQIFGFRVQRLPEAHA